MRALVRSFVTATLVTSVAFLTPTAVAQDKPASAPAVTPAAAPPSLSPAAPKPAAPAAIPPKDLPADAPAEAPKATGPALEYVRMTTSAGDVIIELNREKAPISVENFLAYVDEDFYAGTIFHRVIKTFMIQGGGFSTDLKEKAVTRKPIKNEWQNGLKNVRGSVAMARRPDPDSATCQFFINVVDNAYLDEPRMGGAYAVFGRVVAGMDVVDRIKDVPTGKKQADTPQGKPMFSDVPLEPVTIQKITRMSADEAKKLIK
jgi:cyclophilin family peptidyl-prolyl cis-trans isomerase